MATKDDKSTKGTDNDQQWQEARDQAEQIAAARKPEDRQKAGDEYLDKTEDRAVEPSRPATSTESVTTADTKTTPKKN